jgi:hypothetical protein
MANEAKEQSARLSAKFDEIKRRKFPGADAITVSIRQKEEFPIQQVIGQLGILPVKAAAAAALSTLLAALNGKLTQTNAAGSEPEFLDKLRQAADVAREYLKLASGPKA